uniref:Antibiotic production activating factor n=1 Tax=Streptomyces lavendulae TaxID=1914 RepID=A0A1Q2SRN1_STRLA|nr:antibiotic production activating factor [Streptomyces lavendulae]
MATPQEPFAEAVGEAVQTAVMSVRLAMAIADAVRRHQQRQKNGAEEELSASEQAKADAQKAMKGVLPPDISMALMADADWPQMAQQLMALKQAGADLEQLLPRVGEIAVTVRDQVAANQSRVAKEGTGEWERMLRETLPAGPVREAILSSPTWPDIAATMAKLDESGIDVRQILAAAHDEGLGVDQAVAKVLAAGQVPTMSRDALLSYGPLSDGIDIPRNLDLDDRARALNQLSISPQENARYARMLKEALPEHAREADLAVTAKQWPLVAARMAKMESEQLPLALHLAGLRKDTSWAQGPGSQVGSRLVQATNHVLRHPPGEAPPAVRPAVSTAAARSQSSTVGPSKAQAVKGAASAEPGVAAYRQQSGPSARQGRAR